MQIKTSRFGEIEIDENKIINFFKGVIGFEKFNKYILLDHKENSPFKWLQSLDVPDLAFLVTDPFCFFQDYEFELSDEDEKELEIKESMYVVILVTVSVPHDNPKEISCNLLAPIVINTKNNLAKQIILKTDKYQTKHYILKEMEKYACSNKEAKTEYNYR